MFEAGRRADPPRHAGPAAPFGHLRPAAGSAPAGHHRRHGNGPEPVTLPRLPGPEKILLARGQRGRHPFGQHLWRDPIRSTLEYAEKLGLAFQLTNIIRDVGEDARKGRIYLPVNELQQFGVTAADLLNARHSEKFEQLMALPGRARPGQSTMKRLRCCRSADRRAQRPGLMMAAIYRALLDRSPGATSYHVLTQRISLTPLRKLWLAWKTYMCAANEGCRQAAACKSELELTSSHRFAVIGGGWAGCAAAVELARRRLHAVTRVRSGQDAPAGARRGQGQSETGRERLLGQWPAHHAGRLQRPPWRCSMRVTGIERDAGAFLTLAACRCATRRRRSRWAPAWISSPPSLPLPAPLHLALAPCCAPKGLERGRQTQSLARFSTTARWMGWTPARRLQRQPNCWQRFDQTAAPGRSCCGAPCAWPPSTRAPEQRLGQGVPRRAARQPGRAPRKASDMLLPRARSLKPVSARRRRQLSLRRHGGSIRTGAKVQALRSIEGTAVRSSGEKWRRRRRRLAHVFQMASCWPPAPASRPPCRNELEGLRSADAVARPRSTAFELRGRSPPATCSTTPACRLAAALQRPGRRCRGRPVNGASSCLIAASLTAADAGLLAVVISAASAAGQLRKARTLLAEACWRPSWRPTFQRPNLGLAKPLGHKVITDKRATFACTPGLSRPANASGLAGLVHGGRLHGRRVSGHPGERRCGAAWRRRGG